MTPCPTCQKPVDTLRARHVGVREGKVVAFCSAECEALGVAMDARELALPMREVRDEPPPTPRGDHISAIPTKASPPAPEPRARGKKDKRAREAEPAAPAADEPAVLPMRTPPGGVKTAAMFDSGPVIEIIRDPATAPAAASGISSEGRDSAAIAGELESSGARTAESSPEPAALPAPPEAPPAKAAAAAAAPAEAAAAPVAAPPTTKRKRRRRDSLDARQAWEWLDDEPAEVVPRKGRGEDGSRAGRRLLVTLLLLAVLGGGGYLAYRYVYLSRKAAHAATPEKSGVSAPRPTEAAGAAAPAPASAETAADEALERATSEALARATTVLRALVRSSDARTQRIAAGALSRTRDADAIDVLARALAAETSEAARLELAYQLARAADARGVARLVAALAQPNRDTKLDAASRLARLGDRRAVAVLRTALAQGRLRLSAARELALLGDPAALRTLEQIRADARATAGDKARATIALARAGRVGAPELRALLADKRNAEAAPVLAELGDRAAVAVLHEQLGFEHVRVDAARALRRIANPSDVADGLRTLSASLPPDAAASATTATIRAAEAILVFVGPEPWSERA